MTQEQQNVFDMVGDIKTHFEAQPDTWNTCAPVSESLQNILSLHREIRLSALVKADGTSGSTQAKELARELSCEKAYVMGRRLLSWALRGKRAEVIAAVDQSRTDLSRGTEEEQYQRHSLILSYAKQHRAELSAYKVNEASIEELETAINTFDSLRGNRREAESRRIFSTANIAALIKKVREELTILDSAVEGLIDNPEFIKTYFIARRITDRRATKAKAEQNGQMQGV